MRDPVNALALEGPDDHDTPEPLPGRPRRRLLNPASAILTSLLLGAAGFFVGIKVEKGHAGGSSSSSVPSGAATAATKPGGTGATSALGGSSRGKAAAAKGSSSSAGARFAGGSGPPTGVGASGSGATTGTVSSVSGRTVYLKSGTGTVIKVRLTSATKVTKNRSVPRGQVRPGDTISVTGIAGSSGTIKAVTVGDSGASSSSSSSTTAGTTTSGAAGGA